MNPIYQCYIVMSVLHKENASQQLERETTGAEGKSSVPTQTKDLAALSIIIFDGEIYTCLAITRMSTLYTYVVDEKQSVHT